ncbi:hypothetical protein STEG23_015109 [Scotinomys teguina]
MQQVGRQQLDPQQLELPQQGRQQLEMQQEGLQQLDTQQLGRQQLDTQQLGRQQLDTQQLGWQQPWPQASSEQTEPQQELTMVLEVEVLGGFTRRCTKFLESRVESLHYYDEEHDIMYFAALKEHTGLRSSTSSIQMGKGPWRELQIGNDSVPIEISVPAPSNLLVGFIRHDNSSRTSEFWKDLSFNKIQSMENMTM